ncbi:hypothetical protein JMM81_06010 [Bacillus sp. V3B]|uniref:hypothetical protein n=1 Tax=Bacillus sp. V3B TaxID=2804915 RepID=UPI00210AC6FF|nr:hypothetical protein [Bacillus sp. V3B]MCQ6274525.1 hypothetical protein [Bacillus sp. V3B]
MMETHKHETEAVGKLLNAIRVKLETLPVRNSKIMKSFEILDRLETEALVGKPQDKMAIERLIIFLASITLAPIKQELNQLNQHLQRIHP